MERMRKTMVSAPFIDQRDGYPTGCESVSAVMALRAAGVEITVDEFIDEYLPRGAAPRLVDGVLVGADPNVAFPGDPRSANGWGCFAPVIERAMAKALESGWRARGLASQQLASMDTTEQHTEYPAPQRPAGAATPTRPTGHPAPRQPAGTDTSRRQRPGPSAVRRLTGASLADLKRVLDVGVPVVVWVTLGMRQPPLTVEASWITPDGARIDWLAPEHCMLLVGYDAGRYYCNDPMAGAAIPYRGESFAGAFAALGRQALAVERLETEQ
jgi:uncharacterized protein YvpB